MPRGQERGGGEARLKEVADNPTRASCIVFGRASAGNQSLSKWRLPLPLPLPSPLPLPMPFPAPQATCNPIGILFLVRRVQGTSTGPRPHAVWVPETRTTNLVEDRKHAGRSKRTKQRAHLMRVKWYFCLGSTGCCPTDPSSSPSSSLACSKAIASSRSIRETSFTTFCIASFVHVDSLSTKNPMFSVLTFCLILVVAPAAGSSNGSDERRATAGAEAQSGEGAFHNRTRRASACACCSSWRKKARRPKEACPSPRGMIIAYET